MISSSIRNVIKSHTVEPQEKEFGRISVADIPVTYNKELYRKRNFIERLFGRLKENKRIATRFDKLDVCFMAFVALGILRTFKLLM